MEATSPPNATPQQGADLVRRSLPLMSLHGSDFGSKSYALWLAYVEGMPPELKEVLEGVVIAGRRLAAAETAELYSAHLASRDENTLSRVAASFVELLGEATASTSSASQATSAFLSNIAAEAEALQGKGESVPAEVRRLAEHSTIFAHAIAMLSTQLQESQRRIDGLQSQLSALRVESSTDSLTGVANRKTLDSALAELCSRSPAASFSMVMLDIDHFKRINDEYGHPFGDKVLRHVADIMKAQLKGKDLIARYGGEEFAILLLDTSADDALELADKIRGCVAGTRIKNGDKVEDRRVTISCGVTKFVPLESPVSLIDRCDGALYHAKETGRNRVHLAA